MVERCFNGTLDAYLTSKQRAKSRVSREVWATGEASARTAVRRSRRMGLKLSW